MISREDLGRDLMVEFLLAQFQDRADVRLRNSMRRGIGRYRLHRYSRAISSPLSIRIHSGAPDHDGRKWTCVRSSPTQLIKGGVAGPVFILASEIEPGAACWSKAEDQAARLAAFATRLARIFARVQ